MASLIFETDSQTKASNFAEGDTLFFTSGTPTGVDVVFAPPSGLTAATVTLTSEGKSLTFPAATLGAAADIVFTEADGSLSIGDDGIDSLVVSGADASAAWGLGDADDINLSGAGDHVAHGGDDDDTLDVLAGAAGNFTIFGDDGDDVVTNAGGGTGSLTINGGLGDDDLTGGALGDRIFGNALTAVAGTEDGDDAILAGAGNDYVNGNAGDDEIAGEGGNDRLFGGADADDIDGGSENDTVNGNKGEDTIVGGTGEDSLRGGADNDDVSGDAGNDVLQGDLGDDVLTGGDGVDLVSGGDGANVFVYAVGDADSVIIDDVTFYETATDFTVGVDQIDFGVTLDEDGILLQDSGVSFSTAAAALTYAQELLDDDGIDNSLAAIQVGADTYLFYDSDFEYTVDSTIDSFILLQGVTAANLSVDDFVAV